VPDSKAFSGLDRQILLKKYDDPNLDALRFLAQGPDNLRLEGEKKREAQRNWPSAN